jgi:hypothetical protein
VRLSLCLDQGHCICRAFGWQSGSTIAKSTLHHALPRALIPTPFVRYGLGYELSDGSNGVFFNDATKMVDDSCAGGVCGTPLIEYVERVLAEWGQAGCSSAIQGGQISVGLEEKSDVAAAFQELPPGERAGASVSVSRDVQATVTQFTFANGCSLATQLYLG